MTADKRIIRIENLHKTFPGGTQALRGVSLDVYQGEFLVLVGSSGAGKSTLLRSINGLNTITSGSVEVVGVDVKKCKGKRLRSLRREVGMIFQEFNIVKRKRVIDNVLHGQLGYAGLRGTLGLFSSQDKIKAYEILERLGLTEQVLKRADQLSGGQKQRVAIARSIMQGPKIILADEPVASLDPAASERVLGYLQRICQEEGITAIVSLHQVEYARTFAHRIIGLTDGKITFSGGVEELTDTMVKELYYEREEEVS